MMDGVIVWLMIAALVIAAVAYLIEL